MLLSQHAEIIGALTTDCARFDLFQKPKLHSDNNLTRNNQERAENTQNTRCENAKVKRNKFAWPQQDQEKRHPRRLWPKHRMEKCSHTEGATSI